VKRGDLTIAIPYYRGLAYLRETIESVQRQRDPDWQLWVSDDSGGDEDAEALVAGFADDRIRYCRNAQSLGMAGNWNACLDLAAAEEPRTDWVTILHADDRLLPDYVALMRRLSREHPEATALFCAAGIIGANGEPAFSLADAVKRVFVPKGSGPICLEGEAGLERLMAGNFIMCPTLCFRLSGLAGRRFDGRWSQVQDLDLTSRVLLEDGTLVGSREVAFEYRRHPASATARQSESLVRFREELALFSEVAGRARARSWPRAARIAQRSTIVKLHLAYRSLVDLALARPGAASEKWKLLSRRSG